MSRRSGGAATASFASLESALGVIGKNNKDAAAKIGARLERGPE